MTFWIVVISIGAVLVLAAIVKKPSSVYRGAPNEKNPMEGKRVKFVVNESDSENADG